MKLEDILILIDRLEESSISKLVVETEEGMVEISKEAKVVMQSAPAYQASAPANVPAAAHVPVHSGVAAAEPQEESGIAYITSPIVGTYYSSSNPASDPFVKVGSVVEEGQVVCILEAMKLMNEIESELNGEILEILVKNEDMVEFGQKLFKVRVK
ncbi:MAG: acetyl-CoA carboxylase biotin carboxyl carrier protein [Fusobacteria bacterium]|nr:MAG: acetyl-CoA carboxylase biotin carboxyl carrier protein [Fusobacteriota bacterium]KAF0228924.1 MAG: acetyl-CoA carboxylase biotin carboxyl carrier [Fusobacteriota bacterium]